jgi:hypothetical protein
VAVTVRAAALADGERPHPPPPRLRRAPLNQGKSGSSHEPRRRTPSCSLPMKFHSMSSNHFAS